MQAALYATLAIASLIALAALMCGVASAIIKKWRVAKISAVTFGVAVALCIVASIGLNNPAGKAYLAAMEPPPTATPEPTAVPTPEPTAAPTATPTATPTPEPTSTEAVQVGDVKTIGASGRGQGIPCLETTDALDALDKAIDAKDGDGYEEAMQSGFYLHAGQYVRIIDIKILSEEYQLRVLSGDHAHEACWTEDAYKVLFR